MVSTDLTDQYTAQVQQRALSVSLCQPLSTHCKVTSAVLILALSYSSEGSSALAVFRPHYL
jgi:hypothetical protein